MMSGVAPNRFIIGSRKTRTATQRNTPRENSRKMAFPAYRFACSFSPPPMERLKLAAPPIPHIKDRAVQVMVRGKATLVAAFPSVPMLWPIKNWSTML